ncbi:MAG: alginate lyase family protein [Geminicoccaceae bacterium]|nr:alginate lyase family protein [Geminicoccaceae bacterium]
MSGPCSPVGTFRRGRPIRRLIVAAAGFPAIVLFAIAASMSSANALSLEQRRALDLSEYRVTDPDRSYFDVDARRRLLAETRSPVLHEAIEQVTKDAPGCKTVEQIPIIDFKLRMPAYYSNHDEWREAIKPLFAYEDAISALAAASLAIDESYYGHCLIEVLARWADADALSQFHYNSDDRQAWYNIEDMMFTTALAYSVVRGRLPDVESQERKIDAWLNRISRNHISIEGGSQSCCNNHFYRRALHATMIGILTSDDDLFRFGVSAIYSAVSELTADGTLPREFRRGKLAVHYQNYAVLYLVYIAQLIERQGYPAFGLEVGGHTLADAVDRAISMQVAPQEVKIKGVTAQDLHFMDDGQYLSWGEVWLSHFDDPRIERRVASFRPVFNRSAGGYATLYFYDPERDAGGDLPERKKDDGEGD